MSRPATQHKRATYPAYKPSGMEWLGQIPAHWEVRRLKYTATINDEALPETTDPDYEFTYVDIGSVDASKGIVVTETYRFGEAPSRARRTVRQGDTIVSTVRTYLRAIAAIREPAENLIVSTGFAVVRPRSLDPGYLSYALRSPFFVETVVSRSTGVSYPAINAPEVGNIGVTLPPLDEQKAIAAFLDRETARIDALIEKKQQQIELLQEKRSALISLAVTKGLDPDAKMKDSGIEWLGQIPANWEVRRLKYTANLINVKVDGADNDLPYTGLEHIESWTGRRIAPNGEAASEGQANLYRRGDVLFGKLRPYLAKAHAAESEGICTSELLVLRPQAVAQRFLLYYVLNPDFITVVDSSTYGAKMPRANWDYIGNLPALIPPSDEQRSIAAFLDRETARIDALIEKVRKSIDMLREFRASLISAAVTGKIDVRKDDQNE